MKRKGCRGFWRYETLSAACNTIWLIMVCGITIIALSCMISKTALAVILLSVLACGVWFLIKKKTWIPVNFPYSAVWWVLCPAGALCMFWFASSAQVELSWDWGKIIEAASGYVAEENMGDKVYFARYPNNQFWFVILVLLFKIVRRLNPSAGQNQFYLASVVMGCLMVTGAVVLLYMTAKLLWGTKRAFFAGCAAYMCIPLYMWALYAYTDTAGMFMLMLLMYLYVRAEKSSKPLPYLCYMGGIGLAGAIAWKLKVTVFIFLIALVLVLLMKRLYWKKLLAGLLVLALFFSLGKVSVDAGIRQVLPLNKEFCNRHEFPLTHWIMMSLGYGGFRQEDVDFTSGFPTYNEKRDANVREIKRRLQEKGVPGSLSFFFYKKQVRTWGDSTFGGCDYLSRHPVYPVGFLARLVTLEGDLNWLLLLYTSLYYGILLLGMFLSAYFAWRKRGQQNNQDPLLAGRLTMTGIAVFLTIWECNARYLVVFLPLMILLCCEGFLELGKRGSMDARGGMP